MEEDEEYKAPVKIETVEIECKVEIEEPTDIKVERESDDDGSDEDSQSDDSTETLTTQGIKRNKSYKYNNSKKIKGEDSELDDDIEELQSNDPLDISDELYDNNQLNDHDSTDYTHVLEHFTRWQIHKQQPQFTEEVFLSYFNELEMRLNPPSLWSTYCTLKLNLMSRRIVDMNKYHKLKYYIRKITDGYREKESRVFTADDIKTFLNNASDDIYLAWKVALIIGVTGGCRCNELRSLTVNDVKIHGNKVLVQIQESSKKQRSYVISGNYAYYIKKYLELRPKWKHNRLLIPYKCNEFSKRGMGKKKIGSIPTGVAKFLNLPHSDEYTGHTYRRTFALFNPLKQSNSFISDNESDNETENLDNNDIDNKIDYHDNRNTEPNRKMPQKIYKKFLEIHDLFKQWMKLMKVPYVFEDCVLTYFRELAKNYNPMSLWKLFTMLRYILLTKDNLDIRNYNDVTDYLKQRVKESTERTAGAFSAKDIDVFMNEAPDNTYLGTKVALALGVSGACNCQELMNLTINNVRRYGTIIIVKLKDSNKKNKTFIVPDNFYIYIKNYMDLRPKDMIFDKFLIGFKYGKYTNSIMGKAVFRSVPRDVASYLKISNAEEYTGHYLKRTAFVIFNLTTIFITNDGDESDSDNDNQIENSDNKVEEVDKLKITNEKRSTHNTISDNQYENSDNKVEIDKLKNTKYPSHDKYNHNDIDNKNKIDNKYNNLDLEDEFFEVTPDIVEDQSKIDNNCKPGWHPRYDEIYNYFMRWFDNKSTISITEDIMLTYFKELSEKFKPSTLWSQFYVLKRTLIIKNNIDISDYDELKHFLNKKADGFRSTKSRVFTIRQIDDFLEKAPDDVYLHWKVALILGIKGACKCKELLNLTTEHINLNGNLITVKVQETRNRKRKFFISDHYFTYVKKYIEMRPSDCKTNRFLLLIKNKKVIKACVGKNTINNMPKEIANYLNLPFPEEYTGHCFRTTSMSLFRLDALIRSNRQPGQLSSSMDDFSKARNETNEAQKAGTWSKNEAQKTGIWSKNETQKAGTLSKIEARKAGICSKNETQKAENWSEIEAQKAEICSKNETQKAENWSINEANSWPNDGKRALCWPLTIEKDDDIELREPEISGPEWTLNSENGVFEIVDRNSNN